MRSHLVLMQGLALASGSFVSEDRLGLGRSMDAREVRTGGGSGGSTPQVVVVEIKL